MVIEERNLTAIHAAHEGGESSVVLDHTGRHHTTLGTDLDHEGIDSLLGVLTVSIDRERGRTLIPEVRLATDLPIVTLGADEVVGNLDRSTVVVLGEVDRPELSVAQIV